MKYLCLIPARGGSKGVPGKNLRLLGGKPLIAWTIEQALSTVTEMRVVVSTDSTDIAEVAREVGADVPFLRPANLADDTSTTESAVLHAIGALARDGFHPDAVILLQATSPIRHRDTISRAIQHFESTDSDSLIGVVRQAPFLWKVGTVPQASYDIAHRPRRQDLTNTTSFFRETGSLYITKTEIYLQQKNRIGGSVSLFEMDEEEGIDIDTALDFHLAEIILGSPGHRCGAT